MVSLRAQRSLIVLGRNLRQARLARRFSMADLAARAGISEKTVQRLEKGEPGIGIGHLASVLTILGDPGALERIFRLEDDAVARARAVEGLPRRGRSFGARPSQTASPRERSSASPDDGDEGVGF